MTSYPDGFDVEGPVQAEVFVVWLAGDHLELTGPCGTVGGVEFASNVMPAGSGRLALSVSKAMMTASHLTVGDDADVEIAAVGRD